MVPVGQAPVGGTARLPIVLLTVVLVTVALLAAACGVTTEDGAGDAAGARAAAEDSAASSTSGAASASDPSTGPASSSTTIENYPDAQTRALAARARELRPVDNSALPPRHLEPERHPESLVDRFAIVSGGPPPDGIPSIDEPTFGPVDAVDWLADEEPVAVLTFEGETRIYPTQILIWHEIVNHELAGRPITMTYCPLCNSVVAVEAITTGTDGQPLALDFGTSGALYQSALVMYDRQTESLWTHFDGRSVIGTLAGAELTILPAAMVAWIDARAAHPGALVLDRPTGSLARPYGTVPYPNYETAPPSAGYVVGPVDDRLEPKQRVVGIDRGGVRTAIDRRTLEADGALTVIVGGEALIALWDAGTASALDGEEIADGVEVGAVGVFRSRLDGRDLTFDPVAPPGRADGADVDARGVAVDRETGSTWTVLGQAVAGPLAGERLEPVAHLDTFWFAWSRYHPDTDVAGIAG